MNDLLQRLALCAALLSMMFLLNNLEFRLSKVEGETEGNYKILKDHIETGPSCTCRSIQTLLKNRPYPPPSGVKHSFTRPFSTCDQP